ncbi:hypothetical protein F8388_026757 [Cannabis sativa]|uniref:Uncharacterized protein n=1 Tax=Cannabis sativa TaxID=3483 RepID=A0A7J6H2C2_CANSA|nr:hypothetical protein F8388_026757 [Cannabis sativa]
MGHRCCNKLKVKRGLWSPEEDEKLLTHITTHGHGNWSSVPKLAGLQRCGKSCRLRWINYLRPDLRKGSFTQEEEQIIIDVHRILGNRPELLDDMGLCDSSFDPIQASKMLPENDLLQQKQPLNYQNQGQDHDKVWEMEMGNKDRIYDDDSNFDLGFMESNFNLSGVMCHDLSSMEYDLAWNY